MNSRFYQRHLEFSRKKNDRIDVTQILRDLISSEGGTQLSLPSGDKIHMFGDPSKNKEKKKKQKKRKKGK